MKKGKRTYIDRSEIDGNGLFASEDLSRDSGFFGTTHVDNWPTTDLGKNYNHSDTPNARVTKIGNRHLIIPIGNIKSGEEITVDYRNQPELEQPQEGWKCGGKIKGYQEGGGIEPKISFTKEQLDEYSSTYEGEGSFMDQVVSEYRDMGYFPVLKEDGSLSAYQVADISEGIMQHGYRGKKLAEMLGADRSVIDETFQPVYDYHASKYDARGKKMVEDLMNRGLTKQGAFNYLMDKKKFGTQEGLERIFGQTADDITRRQNEAKKLMDEMSRNKIQESSDQTYTPPLLMPTQTSLTSEQLRSKALEGGPRVEGLKYWEEANKMDRAEEENVPFNSNFAQPEISESTGMSSSYLGRDDSLLNDPEFLMTPQQRDAKNKADYENFVRQAKQDYIQNRRLWDDELGIKMDDYVTEDGEYDWAAIGQKMYSPEMKKSRLENYKKQEQAAWDEMPWYEKAGQGVVAFLDDPILTGANWMEGKGPMVGQHEWLSDPEKAQELASKYGITTEDLYDMSGDSDSWINDAVKYVNPLHYASQAGVNAADAKQAFERGEYSEGFKELGNAGLDLFAGITGAKGASAIPGAATATQLGAKQVIQGVAKPSQLFKRGDLARVTGKESLDELKQKIASGAKIDPSDAMWSQRLKNNPELKKYMSGLGDDALIRTTPLTEAAASQYKLPNLVSAMEKGKPLPTGVGREAVTEAAERSIPSKLQIAKNPELKKKFFEQPLETRLKINEMTSRPNDYWYTKTWKDDLNLQSAMKDPKFTQADEFLLPRQTTGFVNLTDDAIATTSPLLSKNVIKAEKEAASETLKAASGRQAGSTDEGGIEEIQEQEQEKKKGLFSLMGRNTGRTRTGRRKHKWI